MTNIPSPSRAEILESLSLLPLIRDAIATYWLPILLAGAAAVPSVGRRTGEPVQASLRYLPVPLWCYVFTTSFISGPIAFGAEWVPRFGFYSFLALAPIACLIAAARREDRATPMLSFGAIVGLTTVLIDWSFVVLCSTPLPLP